MTMPQKSILLVVTLFLLCTLTQTVCAQGFMAQFTDSLDGQFDLTRWLDKAYNLYGGIDIARGPEQWAWYIVFGQWWNGL